MRLPRAVSRRGVLAGGSGVAAVAMAGAAAAEDAGNTRQALNARGFGAIGDGVADDTDALQRALDATFRNGGGFLVIPPGRYRVTRTLRVALERGTSGNITRQSGIRAHGARLESAIAGGNVLEISSRVTARFLLIEGLDILGSHREGHGILVECDQGGCYLYNFCLRDIVVQGCGGDGCAMVGNVFEGQIFNSYFRDNRGNGASFANGKNGGILSSIHVFGCVFGQNGQSGAAMINNCYDVAFHGCYFLLNGKFGLIAPNGCTLLDNCGFENNHMLAKDFPSGDAGIDLGNFGTLVGCTAYSIYKQTRLIRAYVVGQLVMVGCTGSGGGAAKGAGLAQIGGKETGQAVLIGCAGVADYTGGFEGLELGGAGGIRFGSSWRSRNLPRLGEYRLWVDKRGRLRIKRGAPTSDGDGETVGA